MEQLYMIHGMVNTVVFTITLDQYTAYLNVLLCTCCHGIHYLSNLERYIIMLLHSMTLHT